MSYVWLFAILWISPVVVSMLTSLYVLRVNRETVVTSWLPYICVGSSAIIAVYHMANFRSILSTITALVLFALSVVLVLVSGLIAMMIMPSTTAPGSAKKRGKQTYAPSEDNA